MVNRIESSAVERTHLSNFSYENETDQDWYNFFDNGLQPLGHIRNVEKILEATKEAQTVQGLMKNLESAVCIAKRYHREKVELELALHVMDYKLSKLAQFAYDTLAGFYTPEALEELDRFFSSIGITKDHPLDRNKAKRPQLRLVK